MASTQVQITGGAFQDVAGNVLANGYLLLNLSQDAQVNNQEVGAGVSVSVPLDSSGNVVESPAVNLWPNDVLSPQNTYYSASAYSESGQLVWGPSAQQVLSPSPFDIGSWVPASVAIVSQQGGSIAGLIEPGTNVSFTGSGTVSSPYIVSSTGGGADAITALTGDVTATGPGSVAATLATVNADAGTVGSATAVPVITSDAKGRITATSTAALGTIAMQNANSVTITGGTVDSVSVGATTPSTGSFTILETSGNITCLGEIIVGDQISESSIAGTSTLLKGENASGSPTWSLTNETGAAKVTTLAIGSSQAVSGLQGTSGTKLAATTGSFTSGNLVVSDASGNLVDSGVAKPSAALGTMATQNASTVAVTGGAVDGTAIGSTTASSVNATTLTASGVVTINSAYSYTGTDNVNLKFVNSSSPVFQFIPTGTTNSGNGTKVIIGDNSHPRFIDFNNYLQMGADSSNNFLWVNEKSGGGFQERMRLTPTGTVAIGTTSPSSSAILQAASTTQGFLPPVMTTTQKNAISSPAAGLCVYDSTLAALCFYDGTAWKTVTAT